MDWREASVLVGCLALFVLLASAFFRVGFFDDSFITFRYARNLSRGAGLSWNAAEGPLEGFTGLGWVLLLGGIARLSALDVPTIAVALGLGCGLACLVLTWLCLKRLLPMAAPWWASLLGVAQLTLTPEFVRHARSGMETLLTTALLLTTLLFWCSDETRLPRGSTWLCGGALAAAASLARPDAILFGVALGSAHALKLGDVRRAWRAWAGFLGAFAVGLLTLWLARRAYFGEWIPLPAYLKMRPRALLQSGPLNFVLGHWLGYLGLVCPSLMVLALAAGAGGRRLDFRLQAALFAAAAYAAYFLTVLPIMSLGFRYLIPTLPVFCIVAAWGLSELASTVPPGQRRGWLALAVVALLAQGLGRFHVVKRDSATWSTIHAPYADLGRRLRAFSGLIVAASEVGELSWYSDATVVDLAGLNDTFIAKHRFSSGNFKAEFAEYMRRRQPDVYVDPPAEYGYATMASQPELSKSYYALSLRGLSVFIHRDRPSSEALLRVLAER